VKFNKYCQSLILFYLPATIAYADTADVKPVSNDKADPKIPYSAEIWDYLTKGASLTIGIGGREADLTVTRLSDNASGKLVQRKERSYFLNYSTRPGFFKDSHFGYDIMFNLSTFDMDQQEVSNSVYKNLGTGGTGKFAYIVPTIFYMWGDHRRGTYFKSGFGIGAGIATFDGDIILTSTPTNDHVQFSHQTTQPSFATSIVVEGRWNNWGIIISGGGPNFKQDGYEFQLSDIAVNFGYRYAL